MTHQGYNREDIERELEKYKIPNRGIHARIPEMVIQIIPTDFNGTYWDIGSDISEVRRQDVYRFLYYASQAYKKTDPLASYALPLTFHEVELELSERGKPQQLEIFIQLNLHKCKASPFLVQLINKYKTTKFSLGFVPYHADELRILKNLSIFRKGALSTIFFNKKKLLRLKVDIPYLKKLADDEMALFLDQDIDSKSKHLDSDEQNIIKHTTNAELLELEL